MSLVQVQIPLLSPWSKYIQYDQNIYKILYLKHGISMRPYYFMNGEFIRIKPQAPNPGYRSFLYFISVTLLRTEHSDINWRDL